MHRPDRLRGAATLELALLTGAIVALTLSTILSRPVNREGGLPDLPGLRAICLDASASATSSRSQWPRRAGRFLREQCRLAQEQNEEVLLVEYAGSARRVFGPGLAQDLLAHLDGRQALITPGEKVAGTVAGAGASRLAEALNVSSPFLLNPRRSSRRLILHGDGTYTGSDPAAVLELLARAHTRVEWVDLGPPDRPRLGIDGLTLPGSVAPGSASAALVKLAWHPAGASRAAELPQLNWSLSGPGGTNYGVALLDLASDASPGPSGRLDWTTRLNLPPREPGTHALRVQVAPAGTPAGPLTDGAAVLGAGDQRTSGWLNVGQRLRLAVVQREPSEPLSGGWQALEKSGLDLRPVQPGELLGVLPEVDAVLTLDVGPAELPGRALEAFVDAGGGWLATIGWQFLGSWSPAESAAVGDASALLPLDPGREGGSDRDVVLLVDGSGSMSGQPFERVREALFQLVPAALPVDRLELRFFNESLGPVEFRSTGQTPAERRKDLSPLLRAKVPRGGTDILYSLGQLAASRRPQDAPGLVLLLSDGRSTGSSRSAGAQVRATLTQARLDLSVLVVGDHADRGCLPSLLTSGESLIEAGDLSSLADLLQREVNQRRVRSEPDQRAAPGTPVDPLTIDVLAAQVGAGAVLLAAPTCARAEWGRAAERLWITQPGGDPLLAVRHHGRGLVAALATHPGSGWAPDLLTSPGALTPLLRALAGGRVDRRREVRLVTQAGLLVLEPTPLDWPEPLTCEFWPPLRELTEWLEQPLGSCELRIGPGGSNLDPRRRRSGLLPATLDALPRGTLLEARVSAAGETLASLPFLSPGPPEWSGQAQVVSRALPGPGPPPSLPRPRSHPLAPWFLALGVGLGFLAGLIPLRRLWAR